MSWLFVYGGGGRIRTIEGGAGRFTVCSLWPLGNPSRGFLYLESVFPTQLSKCFLMRASQEIIWWRGTDSNHRRRSRQIYSLLPLATREPLQGFLYLTDVFPTSSIKFSLVRRIWWRGTDSNHRRRSRQIYSLLPLATREPLQGFLYLTDVFPTSPIKFFSSEKNMVEGDGFEPSKAEPADLQSAPFGHSGTPPGYFYT